MKHKHKTDQRMREEAVRETTGQCRTEVTNYSVLRTGKGKKIRITPAKKKTAKKTYSNKSDRIQASIRRYCLDKEEMDLIEKQIREKKNNEIIQKNKKERKRKRHTRVVDSDDDGLTQPTRKKNKRTPNRKRGNIEHMLNNKQKKTKEHVTDILRNAGISNTAI